MQKCDVLIVTHHAGDLLAECLVAVRAQTCPPERIVVVVSSLVEVGPIQGVEIIQSPSAEHFAPAANRGLRALGGRPIVLLNDDTSPAPDFLQELVSHIAGPGIYQPRITLEDGRTDNTGHMLFWDGFNVARDRGTMEPQSPPDCGAFSGAAVMFTPEVLISVGVFDEDFGAYGEDLDLSLRAVRLGFSIRYVPTAHITHKLGATYGRVTTRKIFLVERNRTAAAIRSLPKGAIAALPATSALRISVMGAAALRGRGLGRGAGWQGAAAALAGIIAGVTVAPRAWAKRRRDRESWTTTSSEMWSHLNKQRAPLSKLAGETISER